jgi:chitinase
VYFNLDVVLKSGCVERAIVSAGGPSVSCQGMGFGKRKRDLLELGVSVDHNQTMTTNGGSGNSAHYSAEKIAEFQSLHENVFPNSNIHAPYVPMDWSNESAAGLSNTANIVYAIVYVDPS